MKRCELHKRENEKLNFLELLKQKTVLNKLLLNKNKQEYQLQIVHMTVPYGW